MRVFEHGWARRSPSSTGSYTTPYAFKPLPVCRGSGPPGTPLRRETFQVEGVPGQRLSPETASFFGFSYPSRRLLKILWAGSQTSNQTWCIIADSHNLPPTASLAFHRNCSPSQFLLIFYVFLVVQRLLLQNASLETSSNTNSPDLNAIRISGGSFLHLQSFSVQSFM